MKISVLPTVLQDLVMLFCFNLPKEDVLRGVDMILDIKDMGLPFFFFRERIWSWEFSRFLPNPLKVFLPIEYYGGLYRDLFDDDCTYYLLLCLDFRRRNVRMFGNREAWHDRFASTWRAVEPFAAFYKMLLRTKQPVLKMRSPLLGLMM
jgi:hypothetical protein